LLGIIVAAKAKYAKPAIQPAGCCAVTSSDPPPHLGAIHRVTSRAQHTAPGRLLKYGNVKDYRVARVPRRGSWLPEGDMNRANGSISERRVPVAKRRKRDSEPEEVLLMRAAGCGNYKVSGRAFWCLISIAGL